jgi:hypothetical protein
MSIHLLAGHSWFDWVSTGTTYSNSIVYLDVFMLPRQLIRKSYLTKAKQLLNIT